MRDVRRRRRARRARRASAAPRSRATRGTAPASPCAARARSSTSSCGLGEVDEHRRRARGRRARAPPSASRASSVYIECGATAGTISSSSANSLMNASARASPSAGVFASATGNWMIVWPSTPRSPASLVDLGDLFLEVIHVGVGRRPRLDHLERGQPRAGAHELRATRSSPRPGRCISAASPSAPGRRPGRGRAPSARGCGC